MASPIEAITDIGTKVRETVERAILRNSVELQLPDYEPDNVANSPKEVVHARGTMRLFHYLPMTDEVYRVPRSSSCRCSAGRTSWIWSRARA